MMFAEDFPSDSFKRKVIANSNDGKKSIEKIEVEEGWIYIFTVFENPGIHGDSLDRISRITTLSTCFVPKGKHDDKEK